jgi:hypothetical protein
MIRRFLSGEASSDDIVHNWAEGELFTVVPYNGTIGKVKGKGKNNRRYEVKYWTVDQTADEGENYDMPAVRLAADYLVGDLILA